MKGIVFGIINRVNLYVSELLNKFTSAAFETQHIYSKQQHSPEAPRTARIHFLSELDMKKKPYQAISALYDKRALAVCDLVLKSPLPPEETIKAIDHLAHEGYVKKYHGDSVVAITDRGLNAGRKKIISSLR